MFNALVDIAGVRLNYDVKLRDFKENLLASTKSKL